MQRLYSQHSQQLHSTRRGHQTLHTNGSKLRKVKIALVFKCSLLCFLQVYDVSMALINLWWWICVEKLMKINECCLLSWFELFSDQGMCSCFIQRFHLDLIHHWRIYCIFIFMIYGPISHPWWFIYTSENGPKHISIQPFILCTIILHFEQGVWELNLLSKQLITFFK